MADNVAITAGTGTTLASDDIAGVQYPRAKLSLGADGTAVDAVAGAGAVDTGTQRVTLGSDDPAVAVLGTTSGAAVTTDANGTIQQYLRGLITATNTQLPASLGSKSVATSLATSVKSGGNEYETVAASQTAQVLGATGAVGDYIEGVLCVVSTASTSQVTLLDNATSIVILPNSVGPGIGSYYIPLGLTSVSGAWKITTAAGVAVIATGDFT